MKNTFKKLVALLVAVLLTATTLVGLASCGEKQTYTIGICQLVKHDALDAATQGFKDAVIAGLGEENVTFIYNEAQGESNTCATIVNDYVTKNVDLIMANATAALQAAYNATTTIPVLGTSITDYAQALGKTLNGDNTTGMNVSGTSDLVTYSMQADAMKELYPAETYKKVGILYCSAEPNSQVQADGMQAVLTGASYGYQVTKYTFVDSNDISAVVTGAVAVCDVLYIPTDNTAASNANTIYSTMQGLGNIKPVFCAEEGTCKGCGVATLTISYYDLGYQTGKMAVKILKGESKIENMPIETASNLTKEWNETIAQANGINTVPNGYTVIAGTEVNK